jgi:hypothetical protein
MTDGRRRMMGISSFITNQPINQFNYTTKQLIHISVLIAIAIIIFYPVFFTEYAYTDEYVQLWLYKKGSNFNMFSTQGRYITEKLFQWLFNKAYTVRDITFIRMFSFFGWIVCLPVWYAIIRKVVIKEGLPTLLIFFSVLYLNCTPPFSIYVSWASCLQQFIADTTGLLSGYILYSSLKYQNNRLTISSLAVTGSMLFGIISLFTYQNGFGCFLLPFLLHLIARPKTFRIVFIGIAFCLLNYIVYYLLFKYSVKVGATGAVGRTQIDVDLFPKIRFFFGRALAIPFHFTYLFNEEDLTGAAVYLIVLLTWLISDFYLHRFLPFVNRLKLFFLTVFVLALIYLPSLVVKENYASNRTLFALNMGVFFLVANTLLIALKKHKTRMTIVTVLCFLFIANAWYNFNLQFLKPIKNEYRQVRGFIEKNYSRSISTVYFIQPREDFFVKKYGITRSWDEFGVPSTFFNWVPEFFTRQVVFEKTGDRSIAEKLTIKQWPDKKRFLDSSFKTSSNTMLIDVEQIMK